MQIRITDASPINKERSPDRGDSRKRSHACPCSKAANATSGTDGRTRLLLACADGTVEKRSGSNLGRTVRSQGAHVHPRRDLRGVGKGRWNMPAPADAYRVV